MNHKETHAINSTVGILKALSCSHVEYTTGAHDATIHVPLPLDVLNPQHLVDAFLPLEDAGLSLTAFTATPYRLSIQVFPRPKPLPTKKAKSRRNPTTPKP